MKANAGLSGYPVNIPNLGMDQNFTELIYLMTRYWKNPESRKELGISAHPPD